MQQDGRKKRTATRMCVTNVTGLYFLHVCVLRLSSPKLMFPGLSQKDLLKGEWSSAETFFKQNIVTLVTQGLPSSFLSSPVA